MASIALSPISTTRPAVVNVAVADLKPGTRVNVRVDGTVIATGRAGRSGVMLVGVSIGSSSRLGIHAIDVRDSGNTTTLVSANLLVTIPAPAGGVLFGLASHPMWYGRWQADIERMAAAGLRYLRMDCGWRWLEPSRGLRDSSTVDKLDRVIAFAQGTGIKVSISVIECPSWAAPDPFTPPPPADYANIVGWLAARYKGKGVVWEVWNEPNLPEFWLSGTGDRAVNSLAYSRVLAAAYAAVKAADPAALVLGGSACFNDTDWLTGLVQSGAPYDALAIHPYALSHAPDDRSDPYYSFCGQIEEMHAMTGKDIWITECGYRLGDVAESTRARHLSALAAAARSYPFVRAVALYTDDYTKDPTWSLLNTAGQPLPSWISYVGAAQ